MSTTPTTPNPSTQAPHFPEQVTGMYILARALKNAGIARFAAPTHGFLTKKPGVLLTVSSLGFMNGLTATANATVNCYPMIQISGSSVREPIDLEQGTYEGLDQLNVAKGLVKAANRGPRGSEEPRRRREAAFQAGGSLSGHGAVA